MPTRILAFALLLMLATHPARAQGAPGSGTPPQIGPQSGGPSSSETGIGVAQVLVGTLATFATGVGVAILAAETDSAVLAYIGVGATPGVGAWVVCRIGRTSVAYEGGCGPTVLGGYLGAILLGIPMGYVGAAAFAPSISDGGYDRTFGAVYGAVLGVVVGTAVGATIGWHVYKHRRGAALPIAFGPPPPPPAAVTEWSDLRPHPAAARGPTAVGVPLLSLRF